MPLFSSAACKYSQTADRFTNAPTTTCAAAWQCSNAFVPLVVVNTTVVPCTVLAVYSAGEFPKSKPGIGNPPGSPHNKNPRWPCLSNAPRVGNR